MILEKRIALSVALLLLTLLAGTALLGVAGHFLVATALATASIGYNFFAPSAGIRALTFVRILSRYAEKIAGHDLALRIAANLRVQTFARLLPLAPLELGKRRGGDILNRLLADVEQLDGLWVRALGPLFALGALGLLAAIVALSLDLATGAALLALLACAFALPVVFDRYASALEPRTAQARDTLRAGLLEAFEGASDLRALHAEARFLHRVEGASEELETLESRQRRRLALAAAGHAKLLAWGLPLLLWLLFRATAATCLSAPEAAGLWFMALAALEAAAGFAPAWQALQAARAARSRLDEISSLPRGRKRGGFRSGIEQTTAKPPDDQSQGPLRGASRIRGSGGQESVPSSGALELRDVSFRWDDASRDVLLHANLRIEPGQRIAIRGDSGAGKSSLFALLLGLREPRQGSVAFAGTDLREFDLAQWHARIAWLPQDAPVFSGSVRDNLLLGAPDADDGRLWRALQQVQLDAAIGALQGQLDAWIGPSGATLSAGQARRLALARALLREAPILLLDEPGEGLDADTADALLRDIADAAARRGASVVVITHGELPDGAVDASYRLIDGALS